MVMENSPTQEQLKAVFMLLPANIIGQGISRGFEGTDFGDEIYRFIGENEGIVRAKLATALG